jgi:hypothetical protein
MMGIAKFLVDKEVILKIDFDDPRESFMIKGKFIRYENVEGKKELIAMAMGFHENAVPMSYKMRINDYLSTTRAEDRGAVSAKTQKDNAGTEIPSKSGAAADPAAFSIPDQ